MRSHRRRRPCGISSAELVLVMVLVTLIVLGGWFAFGRQVRKLYCYAGHAIMGDGNHECDPDSAGGGGDGYGSAVGGSGRLTAASAGARRGAGNGSVQLRTLAKSATDEACFVAGTPVWTDDGPRAIETIAAGDRVWARDPDRGERSLHTVVDTYVHRQRALVRLALDDDAGGADELWVTPEHPFFVDGRGFIRVGHLWPGALVDGIADRPLRVVAVEERPERADVYNLEVEALHTYFAGRLGALVHNAYPPPGEEPVSFGQLQMTVSQLEQAKREWMQKVDTTADDLRKRLANVEARLNGIDASIPGTLPTRDKPVSWHGSQELGLLRAQLHEARKIRDELKQAEQTLREPAAMRGRLQALLVQLAPPDPTAPPRPGGLPPLTEQQRQLLLQQLGLPPNALDPNVPAPARKVVDWDLEALAQVRLGMLVDRPKALEKRVLEIEARVQAAEKRIADANRALRIDLDKPENQALIDREAGAIIGDWLKGLIDGRAAEARLGRLVERYDPDGDADTAAHIKLRYAVQREQRLGDALVRIGLGALERPDAQPAAGEDKLMAQMAATVQRLRPELRGLGGATYKKMLTEAMRPQWEALKRAGATVDADGRWDLRGARLGPTKLREDEKLRQALTYFFGSALVDKLADPKRYQVLVVGKWAVPPGDTTAVRTFEQWQKDVQYWVNRFRDRDLPDYLSSLQRANHWGAQTEGIFWRGAGEDSPAQIEVNGNYKMLVNDIAAVAGLGAPPETLKQLWRVMQQAGHYEQKSIAVLQGEITKVGWVMATAPLAPVTMFVAPAATPFIALGLGTAGATASIKTAIQIHYGDGKSGVGEVFYNNIVMDGSGAIITAPLALLGPAAGRVAQLGGVSGFSAQQVAMWTNVGVGGAMSGKSLWDAGNGYVQAIDTLKQADKLDKNATSDGERWLARALRAEAWSTITDSTSSLGWGLFGAKATAKGTRDTLAFRQQMLQARTFFEPLLLKQINPSLKPGATLPEVEAAIKAQRLSGRGGGRDVDAAFEMLSRMHDYFGDHAWLKSPMHPITVEAKVVDSKVVPSTKKALVPVARPMLPAPVERPMLPAPAAPKLLPAPVARPMLPAPRGEPASPADLRGGAAATTPPAPADALPPLRYTRAEVHAMAERSAGQLADRSARTLETLRGDPAAREIERMQVGGGLAVAAVDGKTFLVDLRGRWPADNSREIFQSARELRKGFVAAGLDDPYRYVDHPDQLVPLEAVTQICDARALGARGYVQARAEVVGYSDGKWTVRLHPTDDSAPVDVRVKELQLATGLGPIRVPIDRARWDGLRNAGKAWFGDEVVSTKFTVAQARGIDTMIIIGVGGTAISTAKSYLQLNPRGRVIFVGRDINPRAFQNTSGAADFNQKYLDRCEFYLGGRPDYVLHDGKVSFDPTGMQRMVMGWGDRKLTMTPAADLPATVRGEALVSAIVRENDRLPDPIGGLLGDAYRDGRLQGATMFDGDGRYLGYRISTTDGGRVDVIGASGRVVPARLRFSEQTLSPTLVQAVIDQAVAQPSASQRQAVDALRARGTDISFEELSRIWQRHNLVTPGQRRAAAAATAAGRPVRAQELLTRESERELVEREGVGIERVMLGMGNFAVGAGGSAVTASAYRRAVVEAPARSGPLVISSTPAGGVHLSGSVIHRLVGYDVMVDRGIVLFSRADGALRLASLAQVEAAKPGIYTLTLHGDGEGGAYFNSVVNGQVVARPIRVDALIAKVKRLAGRGDARIDGIYVGACDSPALLARVARETGRWAFGPAGREAVTLTRDGRAVVMTVYDAEGRPLPANRAYVVVDPEGRQSFVEDPTLYFEPGKAQYDATRPLAGAEGMRAPAPRPGQPAAMSTPAASPKEPLLVLPIPGSLGGPRSFPKLRGAFGTPEIAQKANLNFASAAQLDVHGQFVNGTDLTAFQGYLDRLYQSNPAWRARVDAVKPPRYVKTQALQAHEIVASFWSKGLPGISDPRQQLALEAYLYWAFDEQLPALRKTGRAPDGVMLNAFSQSNLAMMELLSRVAARDLRTPGGVRLTEQRIAVNGVAPAVGFQSLRAAIFKMPPLPDRWTVTFFQTADRASHLQHLVGTLMEIVFDPSLAAAMGRAPARPNVRVVELAWPYNPKGALWNPRHIHDVTFAQFIEWMGGDVGAKLMWSALLTGESPLTIEAASGMGSWIKLADSNGRAIDMRQATRAMAARLKAEPGYRAVYNARLEEAKAVLALHDDARVRQELERIEAWDREVIAELKAIGGWGAAVQREFQEQRAPQSKPAPPSKPAPQSKTAPAQPESHASAGDGDGDGKLLPLPAGRSLQSLASAVGPEASRAAAVDSLQDGLRAAARAIAAAPEGGGGGDVRLDRIFVDDRQQARFVGGIAGGSDGLRALVEAIGATGGLRDGERERLARAAVNEFSRVSGVDAAAMLAERAPAAVALRAAR